MRSASLPSSGVADRQIARQARESLTLPAGGPRRDRQPARGDRVDLERAADVLELELPQVHELKLRLIPDLIVNGIDTRLHRDPKDSIREAMFTASRSDRWFDDHIAHVMPIRTGTSGGWRSSFWISMAQRTRPASGKDGQGAVP